MTDRTERITEIVSSHINVKTLSILKQGIDFPISKNALKEQLALLTPEQGPLAGLTTGLMQALRAEGLVHACPNNGPRDVRSMNAWNIWMETGDIEQENHRWHKHSLFNSTGFGLVNGSLLKNMFMLDFDLQKTGKTGLNKDVNATEQPEYLFSESDFDLILSRSAEDMVKAMNGDPLIWPFLYFQDKELNLHCKLTDKSLSIGDDPLKPVLMAWVPPYSRVVLPSVKPPKIARHLILQLPSQTLVMADHFRIKGFREGLVALVGHDDHSINGADGRDERMRDYMEKAGLAIVQTSRIRPDAYGGENGIWRMGHVDDTHEIFLNQDGSPTDISPPEPLWNTCTDIWANCLADRQTVIDILMASGLHETRDAAGELLDAYIEETHGASSIAMPDVDWLHVYAPTGYGTDGKFTEEFQANEIERREWQEDAYILSGKPLTVPEHLLETEILHGPERIALKDEGKTSGLTEDMSIDLDAQPGP